MMDTTTLGTNTLRRRDLPSPRHGDSILFVAHVKDLQEKAADQAARVFPSPPSVPLSAWAIVLVWLR